MIEVENLSKIYGSTLAIEDVSFSVGAGEILGFLGPNGAGKTTTMRILTGYLPASRGTAKIAGYEVHQDSMAVRQRIGYLPETLPLYPDMTVEGYLHFVARLKLVSPGDRSRQVYEAMQRCNLMEKDKVLIRKLSKGYRQRVGIAQAIVHNPPVIILDEPTSALDPRQIIEVRNLIKSLAGDHTVVLSTHILSEASATCTQVAIINRGKMVAMDSLDNMMGKLSQGSGYELEIEEGLQEKTRIVQIIQDLKGVRSVETISTENPAKQDSYVLRVLCETEAELAPQIVAALGSAEVNLSEMRRTRASLEDVFLQLTAEAESSSLLLEEGDRDKADGEKQPISDSENNSPEAKAIAPEQSALPDTADIERPEAGEEAAELEAKAEPEQIVPATGSRRGFFSWPWGRAKTTDKKKEAASGNSQELIVRDSIPSPGSSSEDSDEPAREVAYPSNLADESATRSEESELEATAKNAEAKNIEELAAKVSEAEETDDSLKEDLWRHSSGSASGEIESKLEIGQNNPEPETADRQIPEPEERPVSLEEDKESGVASREIEAGRELESNLSSSSQSPKEPEKPEKPEKPEDSPATDNKGQGRFGWWPWGRRSKTPPEPPEADEKIEPEASSDTPEEGADKISAKASNES